VAKKRIINIQVVPGNHDINRELICRSSEMMLDDIVTNGEDRLDFFLELEKDREVFYGRFADYREFAEGYNCPLDPDGGTAGEKSITIAPERTLRFIGLNSALCCAKRDSKGTLLLGARQRALPRRAGEELVVICHHPLPWLRDSIEARQYVQSRARVFISGHEHTPQLKVDKIGEGCDLLDIASGATTPPAADDEFTFTYNLLEFQWDEEIDGLGVTVHPRVWSAANTAFEPNINQFGSESLHYLLECPNFRSGPRPAQVSANDTPTEVTDIESNTSAPPSPNHLESSLVGEESAMPDKFSFLLLHFFRDLTAAQRLAILVELGALPKNWTGALTHPMERRAFDSLRTKGMLEALDEKIRSFLKTAENGDNEQ
jgi:GTPase-associated adaptor domain